MVTKWILDWFAAGIAWLGGLLDVPGPPAFITSIPGYIADASQYLAGTGPWIPWAVIVTVLAAYAVCVVAGVALKVARIVASFMTLGGGSAA